MRRAWDPEKGSTRARQREYSTAGNLGWGGDVCISDACGSMDVGAPRPAPPTRPQGACPLSISPKGGEV